TGRSPHFGLIHGEEVRHIDDDLSPLQCEAARNFRNASVEADHQPDPPQIGIDNRTTALAKGKPILVMRCQKLLVEVDCDLALAIELYAGIENALAAGIPFGDPVSNENTVLACERSHCRHEGTVRYGLREQATMIR